MLMPTIETLEGPVPPQTGPVATRSVEGHIKCLFVVTFFIMLITNDALLENVLSLAACSRPPPPPPQPQRGGA